MFHGTAVHTGYINVLGPQIATLKWKIHTGVSSSQNPPNSIAIGTNGVMYVGGAAAIFAIDSTSGQILWYKNYSDPQGPAIDAIGNIYFAVSGTDQVVSLSPSGDVRWTYTTGGMTIFGPIIGSDGTVYQGSWDQYFYAFNPDGTLKWKYLTSGSVSYSASIGPDGTVYVPGGDAHAVNDPHIYALNPSTGSLTWKTDLSYTTNGGTTITPPRVSTPTIASDGTIYAPASGVLEALNSAGTVLWTLGSNDPPQQQPAGVPSSLMGPDGTVYLVGTGGFVTAVNPSTHQPRWTYQMGCASSMNCGAPMFPVVDNQGDTYWGSLDQNVYALNFQGQLLWKYATGGGIAEAAAAMDAGGNLYFSSDDGYTYCIRGPSQPATTTTTVQSSSSTLTSTRSSTTSTSVATQLTSTTSTLLTSSSTSISTKPSTTSTSTASTSTAVSATTTSSTSQTTAGGIPEFPVSPFITAALTAGVVLSYLLMRRRSQAHIKP